MGSLKAKEKLMKKMMKQPGSPAQNDQGLATQPAPQKPENHK
jgi:hypothetical protein